MKSELKAREIAQDKQDKLFDAWQRGVEVAAAYKVGDIFQGAWVDADAAGYKEVGEHSMFVSGYLATLPQPVVLGEGNTILELGQPRSGETK